MDVSEIVWLAIGIVLLLVWIWILFAVVVDVLRRADLSGFAKAAWCVLVVVIPVIGVIAYAIARPRLTRDEAEAVDAYEHKVSAEAEDTAAQLADLARRHTLGEITDDEYDELRSQLE